MTEDFKDPSELMAKAMAKAASRVFKREKNGRKCCPDCGTKLWKRRKGYGSFSCPNTDCPRDVVDPVEFIGSRVEERFEEDLKGIFK